MSNTKIRDWVQKAQSFIDNLAGKLWKGTCIGILIALTFGIFLLGSYIKTGVSPIVDLLLVLVMLGLILALLFLLRELFQIVRKFNPFFVAVILLALLMTEELPGSNFIGALILFELICGAMIGYALSGNWKRPLSLAFFFLVLAAHVTVIYLLASEGVDQTVPVSDRFWNQKAPDLSLSDPSATGNYQVKTLFYGSGNDKQRSEYGKEVSLKTDSVDATPFFDQSKGFENKLRKIYWGFTSKNYPLNARVWYPEGKGPFPLVLIVHGNHISDDYSDPGYEYLGEL
ncbi:MAG: alpha/beta hydrolase, partial [Bacteroidales bacterium]|nr:alpha/beta hydrolase [Bacteroidales bacterium]